MRRQTIRIVALSVMAALALSAVGAWADSLHGRVVKVLDGDTIEVLDADHHQSTIRLTGIYAPKKAQAFGMVSRDGLASVIADKEVDVEELKKDRHGRSQGKVLLSGVDVNLAQVKKGLAWHYRPDTRDQSPRDQKLYASAEAGARAEHRGLWSDPAAVPPWDFRRSKD